MKKNFGFTKKDIRKIILNMDKLEFKVENQIIFIKKKDKV